MNVSTAHQVNQNHLTQVIQKESVKLQEHYTWLEESMSERFFEEVQESDRILIAHTLMRFPLQGYYSTIDLKHAAIVMCLDSSDADLRILKNYANYGIKNYQSYVSSKPLPFPEITAYLRIAVIMFTRADEDPEEELLSHEDKNHFRDLVKQRNPKVTDADYEDLIQGMNTRFVRAVPHELLALALDMFFRAKTRDGCQYEVRYNEDWEEQQSDSMQIVMAWRNTPKHHFLYRVAKVVQRYGLIMKRVNATYINPYNKDSVLVLVLSIHGINGQPAWDVADLISFQRELMTIKYFATFDLIEDKLIAPAIIPSAYGPFLRATANFVHQALVHIDVNLYTPENIEEDLCRHPELTKLLVEAFVHKFDPWHPNYTAYQTCHTQLLANIQRLDTGQEELDARRRTVLRMATHFVHYTLKTNYFRLNYTAVSFRLDPKYLDEIPFPFERSQKFPELPYAIFFIKGMHFFGFHIRFKDLARGGLRTVYPDQLEKMVFERNNVFTECYNLAYTQHKKNKDIPEGGAKGVIFLTPFEQLESEALILERELQESEKIAEISAQLMESFRKEQRIEFLYQAQRAYVEAFLTIINCDPDGRLRAKYVIDYWKRPEYIYLGPDENMHDHMIVWIANLSKRVGYKPGSFFISGSPTTGINHKHYGVTSLGVNVYADAVLRYLGINPDKEAFTVKISGGPDGDVAGNEIKNLLKYYPRTAKLLALTDVSGTIYDPVGLNLEILAEMFKKVQPIRYYPSQELNEGGFLVDRNSRRSQSTLVQQTLCWRKQKGQLIEDWLSGSDMNYLFRNNVHSVKTDLFIPGGGRPRTLNASNWQDFLDETGKPTAKAIIEGANLYLDNDARHALEALGVLIIKDSSANKTGVICSSFEILSGLALGEELLIEKKEGLVAEILERLKACASSEAQLLLRTHQETGHRLTDISDQISARINKFTYELLDYLDRLSLDQDPQSPLLQCFLDYTLPTLRKEFCHLLLKEIPDHHKKAIIACHLAAQIVYKRGLNWMPSIVDIYPLLLEEDILVNH